MRRIPERYPLTLPSGCLACYDLQDMGDLLIDHAGHADAVNGGSTVVGVAGGRARSFNGSTQYIDFGNPAWANPGANDSFSVELWVKVRSQPAGGTKYILGKGNYTNRPWAFLFDGSSNTLMWTAQLASGHQSRNWLFAAGDYGVWHHLVGVVNGSTSKLYGDDALVSTGSPVATTIVPDANSYNVRMGAESTGVTRACPIDGGILRVYNRIIPASEVRSLYNEYAGWYGREEK